MLTAYVAPGGCSGNVLGLIGSCEEQHLHVAQRWLLWAGHILILCFNQRLTHRNNWQWVIDDCPSPKSWHPLFTKSVYNCSLWFCWYVQRYPGRGRPQMARQSPHSKHLWSPSCWPRNRVLVISTALEDIFFEVLLFVCLWVFVAVFFFFLGLWYFVLFVWFNIRFCGLYSSDSYSELTFQMEDVMWGKSVLKELLFWLFTYSMLMPRSQLICE